LSPAARAWHTSAMDPHVRKNRELWDEWTEINVRSAFYDVDGFKRAPTPLDPLVREGLGELAGLSVLHLQCHFGMDTLRLAREAREAVGVDFSPKAIAFARELAAELGLAARFVESDLYALPAVLDGEFDRVFTSYGAIEWLPDLERWGQIIARYLRPGGVFFIADGHPTMWMFDGDAADGFHVRYPYFRPPAPLEIPPTVGNYADPTAAVTKPAYSWPHPLSEVVMALVRAGLQIEDLREHAHAVWKPFPFCVEEEASGERRWRVPPDRPQIPLMFSLRARKPAA
jgi:SAM-dependent methyltransferase